MRLFAFLAVLRSLVVPSAFAQDPVTLDREGKKGDAAKK
jgi:hypothetical protein